MGEMGVGGRKTNDLAMSDFSIERRFGDAVAMALWSSFHPVSSMGCMAEMCHPRTTT